MGSLPPVETLKSPTLHEEVHRAVFPGGLQVYISSKRGFRKRYVCYATHYGSVDSVFAAPGEPQPRRVPDGIAHFLEHTLFETPKGNVNELFARNGAHSNAMTSFNSTVYLFAASDLFYENLGLLLDFVENPSFDPAKVEKERGIIEQEILMYRDDPGWVGYMGLLESLFVEHPLRIDIAGSPESIGRIDVAALDRCYRTFYSPANMILFAIGDIERDELLRFVGDRSKGAAARASEERPKAIARSIPPEPPSVAREEFRREMQVALPKLLLGFKEVGIPAAGPEFLRREMVTGLVLDILFGRSSDGFQRLYRSQLVFDDFSASYHACSGVGYAAIGGETPDPAALRAAVRAEIDRGQCAGIAESDFRRQKRKFIGGFIRQFNSLEFIAGAYTYYRFHGVDLFDAIDVLDSIGRQEIEERLRTLFRPDAQAASVIVPKGT